jgi:hypothetical protein
MKRNFTVFAVLAIVLLTGNVQAAEWVSQGPAGTTPQKIATGNTQVFLDETGNTFVKYVAGWSEPMLNNANCACSDPSSGKNVIGTAYDGWVEDRGSFVNMFDAGVASCAIQNGAVILIGANGLPYLHADGLITHEWYAGWTTLSWPFTAEKIAVDMNGRLVAGSATRLNLEQTPEAQDFADIGEIQATAGSAGPKRIEFKGTTIFVLRNDGTVRKFVWNGSSYAMTQLAFTGVIDIAADNLYVYFVQSAGIFRTSDGVNISAMAPAPADEVSIALLPSGTLYCGTNGSGLYSLYLRPPSTASTLTTTSANFTLSWPAVTGAVGYRIYVCTDYGACTATDLGITRTYTASKSGVRMVYAVAYDSNGYESAVNYKPVCNSADTLRPLAVSDLDWMSNSDTIWVWGRITGDQPGTGSFLASVEVALSTALSSRTWAASVKKVFVPPGGIGDWFVAEIRESAPGVPLTPDTAYQIGAAQRDTCGLGALSIMPVRTQPVSSVGGVTLAWDANTQPGIAGYKIYYGTGTGSGNYNVTVNVGNVTTTSVQVTTGILVCFAATCYDNYGTESGFSNEVCAVR